MYILRTRIKKDIVCEFLPPKRRSRRVVILCGGHPSYPGRRQELMFFLSAKGYWVFLPRYRGSWESGGWFLNVSPHRDVMDVITQLTRGFTDLWSGTRHRIVKPEVYLIGSSFGGPAVLLAAHDARVKKVVALAPVVDWSAQRTTGETIETIARFTRQAFGRAYRIRPRDWNKLKQGGFYNPCSAAARIPGSKILIVHAQNDPIVRIGPVRRFARTIACAFVSLRSKKHLSLSLVHTPAFWPRISRFLSG